MSFSDDVKRFGVKVTAVTKDVFVNVASAAKDSIVNGSPVTGAPGQPVDTGALKNSWQLEFMSPTEARISTNIAYAESNEDGIARPGGGPYVQRSPVGGRWSVRLTVLGMPNLVAAETAKVNQ
jgi:hypothetical protein